MGAATAWIKRKMRGAGRAIIDPAARGALWLRVVRPAKAFQPYYVTLPNRYPEIFQTVQQLLAEVPAPRLLSFGCADGEEAFSLRGYFPAAAITGIDINAGAIRVARRRLARAPDSDIRFRAAADLSDEPDAVFDAIFCMAVLRHGKLGSAPPRCDHLLPFDRFAQAIAQFDRCLKSGGLLIVRHANFRVPDAPAAGRYTCLASFAQHKPSPIYGPDNRLAGADYRETIFRKPA